MYLKKTKNENTSPI